MALLGAQLACVGGGGGAAGGRAPAPSRVALGEIPAARLHIYEAAGRRFDIDWAFLASIGYQECGHGACHFVSPSGCAGPDGDRLRARLGLLAGTGPDDLGALPGRRRRRRRLDLRPRRRGLHRGADPAPGARRPADRRLLRRLPRGRLPLLRRLRGRRRQLRRRGDARARSNTASATPRPRKRPPAALAGLDLRRLGAGRGRLGLGDRPRRPLPARPRRAPAGLQLHQVRAVRGVVRALRRLGLAATPGSRMRGGTAPYAYSGSFYGWVKEHGGRVLPAGATPSPGDAVLFGWGPRASEHVGIVEQVLPGGQITTIDGNFGDRVARVGPFLPSLAVASGAPAPIYAYAEPPGVGGGKGRAQWLSACEPCSSTRSTPASPAPWSCWRAGLVGLGVCGRAGRPRSGGGRRPRRSARGPVAWRRRARAAGTRRDPRLPRAALASLTPPRGSAPAGSAGPTAERRPAPRRAGAARLTARCSTSPTAAPASRSTSSGRAGNRAVLRVRARAAPRRAVAGAQFLRRFGDAAAPTCLASRAAEAAMAERRIVDLFAGAGGWDEGLRELGLRARHRRDDRWACATARAGLGARVGRRRLGLRRRSAGPRQRRQGPRPIGERRVIA